MTKANQLKVQVKREQMARKKVLAGIAKSKRLPGLSMRKLRIRA